MSFTINSMLIFYSYVKLPEGTVDDHKSCIGWWFGTSLFHIKWETHHPNGLTKIFFTGVTINHRPYPQISYRFHIDYPQNIHISPIEYLCITHRNPSGTISQRCSTGAVRICISGTLFPSAWKRSSTKAAGVVRVRSDARLKGQWEKVKRQSGWWFGTCFIFLYWESSSQLTHIFSEGSKAPTSNCGEK